MMQKFKFSFGLRSMLIFVTAVSVICVLYPVLFPPLPKFEDFAPQNTIDGKYAWRMFGGCSISDAQRVFDDSPHNRMFDFGYMGDGAFVFYFPVVENFVMRPSEFSDLDHNRSGNIASNIACHFRGDVSPAIMRISPRANRLASFVLERIPEIQCDARERDIVIREWTILKELSESAQSPKRATDAR